MPILWNRMSCQFVRSGKVERKIKTVIAKKRSTQSPIKVVAKKNDRRRLKLEMKAREQEEAMKAGEEDWYKISSCAESSEL